MATGDGGQYESEQEYVMRRSMEFAEASREYQAAAEESRQLAEHPDVEEQLRQDAVHHAGVYGLIAERADQLSAWQLEMGFSGVPVPPPPENELYSAMMDQLFGLPSRQDEDGDQDGLW